jgi:16S rRNA (guanine966-N2)-methyltransferase
MNLRIISGDLRGRRISLPDRQASFRPTKDRVRQSIAETVKEKIPGAATADFCAGSGAFGIELASRGAASVHFVERDHCLALSLRGCTESFGIGRRCRVVEEDIEVFVKRCPYSYDIIFFDPPYGIESLAALVPRIANLLSSKGILLYEYSARKQNQQRTFALPGPERMIVETKIYGETAVDIMRLEN